MKKLGLQTKMNDTINQINMICMKYIFVVLKQLKLKAIDTYEECTQFITKLFFIYYRKRTIQK